MHALKKTSSVQVVAPLCILLALMAVCFARNTVYQSATGLWEDAVEKSPGKARPHYNLGRLYSDERRNVEALREYRVAERLDPLDPVTHYNIGNVMLILGRGTEAVPEYRAALALQPNYRDALHNFEVAIRIEIDKATAGKNRQAEAAWRNNLGNLFFMQLAFAKSRSEYEAALRLLPGFTEARFNLEKVLDEMRKAGQRG